jgi:hypothetical protein
MTGRRVEMPPSLQTRFDGFLLPSERGGVRDVADIQVRSEPGESLRVHVLYDSVEAVRARMLARMRTAGLDV